MNYTKIESFEIACKALDIKPIIPDFSMVPVKHQKALIALYKLLFIVEAVNEGWVPDWNNSDEYKYVLWPDIIEDKSKPSGFGLSFDAIGHWRTSTTVGSRLCFKDRERAKHTFDTFIELYEDYLLIG